MYHGRTWVHVARRLAPRGLAVLRFDYRGVGESHGLAGTLRLAEPFTEDAIEAAELLLRLGIDRLLVVGTCFGGHIAIAALGSLPVVGCMLIDLPFCDGYLGKPLQRSHPLLGAVDALERTLANGTRIELLYGKPDETLDTTHDAPVADRLCLLEERYAPQFRIDVVEASLHGLMTLDVQALVADHVVEFCSALAPRA
jgi:pimeloyl-ACP methyl ester carboxylesterase